MPDNTASIRAQVHFLACYLTEFIEVARTAEYSPDWERVFKEGTRQFDHPNRAATFHNYDVIEALESLVPLQWVGDCEPPPSFQTLREELAAVLNRWGWGDLVDRGFARGGGLPYGNDDPAAVLTPDEVLRLTRSIKGLEWYLFCLPLGEAPEEIPVWATDPLSADDEIRALGEPLFFRSRRYLDAEGMEIMRQALKELDEAPQAARDLYRAHIMRDAFGVGKIGRNPEEGRLVMILDAAKEFVNAVETCLPIEGDDDRTDFPFAVDWVHAEFFVCRAASQLCEVLDGPSGELGDSSVETSFGWNTQIHFGLRCLASQVDALLTLWDAVNWEQRLAAGGKEPERPVRIKAEELAGIKRSVETIESGMGHFGLKKAGEVESESTVKKRRTIDTQKRLKIITTYHDHKDWSLSQIAAATGADRGHVCRVLKPLRDRDREDQRERSPRGSKGSQGELEAWEA